MAVRLREADSMAAMAELRQKIAELEIQVSVCVCRHYHHHHLDFNRLNYSGFLSTIMAC